METKFFYINLHLIYGLGMRSSRVIDVKK